MKVWLFCLLGIFGFGENLPWIAEGKHGYELELLGSLLPEEPIILEAGAHRGEDTVRIAQKWPRATIYAFEPYEGYFKDLERVTFGYQNIHIFPFGLFSSTGSYRFNVSAALDGASSLFEAKGTQINFCDFQVEVVCKNLDEWAEEEGVERIDYLWLDMEGAELYVLKAAPKMLRTFKVLSTEVNFREYRRGMTQFYELRDFLEDSGFYLYKIWGNPESQATAVFIRFST